MIDEAAVIRGILEEIPETQALPWVRKDDIADAILDRLDRDSDCVHTAACACGDGEEWL